MEDVWISLYQMLMKIKDNKFQTTVSLSRGIHSTDSLLAFPVSITSHYSLCIITSVLTFLAAYSSTNYS